MNTTTIVLCCPRCDYFMKVSVQTGAVGSHGCVRCDGLMEVYIPQELAYSYPEIPAPRSPELALRLAALPRALLAERGSGERAPEDYDRAEEDLALLVHMVHLSAAGDLS